MWLRSKIKQEVETKYDTDKPDGDKDKRNIGHIYKNLTPEIQEWNKTNKSNKYEYQKKAQTPQNFTRVQDIQGVQNY